MEKAFDDFAEIIRGSKRYEMDGTLLTITGYYTGKQITIDLGAIDRETFEGLVAQPEEDEGDEW